MRIIIFIIFLVVVKGQDSNAQKNEDFSTKTTLSNLFKHPENFLTFYYPATLQSENGLIETKLDAFYVEYFSTNMQCFKEKVLFNTKNEDETYRFLWLRSFNAPVLISITKSKNKVLLNTKVLDRKPEWMIGLYGKFTPYKSPVIWVGPKDSIENYQIQENEKFEERIDSIYMPKRFALISINETKELDIKTWNNFLSLVEKCNFWRLSPTIESHGLDGSSWVLEGIKNNNYWFVYRWSPRDSFKECGEYLIKHSNLRIDGVF